MRTRLVAWMALLLAALVVVPARSAGDEEGQGARVGKAGPPTLVIRLASLDRLMADARYVIDLSGRQEEGKQLEEFLKSKKGDKGFEGIDTTKPMGLYGRLGPTGLEDSEAVLLLPIADRGAFLDLLERVNVTTEKGKDGVYTAKAEKLPLPVYFRFARDYLYATVRDESVIAKERLPEPASVLGAEGEEALSVVVRIDQVPDKYKRMAIGKAALQLAQLKEQEKPGETEAQKAVREAILDEMGDRFKSLLNDGREMHLGLQADRQAGELSLTFSLSAREGSKLADSVARLGQTRSMAAGLVGADSAMSLFGNLAVSERVRAALGPAVDELEKKAAEEKDPSKREVVVNLVRALSPTFKAGELDAGFDFRGPGSEDLYTIVVGGRLHDGKAVEKALRQALKELPEDKRSAFQVDVARAGNVGIHKVVPEKVDEKTRQALGDNPFYFAIREDSWFITGGQNGLAAIKEAVEARPKAAPAARFEVSLARLAPLLGREQKAAPEMARKAFKGKQDDQVQAVLEGGKTLRLRLSMKGPVVTFISLMDKAKKGQQP